MFPQLLDIIYNRDIIQMKSLLTRCDLQREQQTNCVHCNTLGLRPIK
jgi:hypothetical protein